MQGSFEYIFGKIRQGSLIQTLSDTFALNSTKNIDISLSKQYNRTNIILEG